MYRLLPTIVGTVGFVVFVFGVVCCLYIVPSIEQNYFLQGEQSHFQSTKLLQLRVYLFTVINANEVIHSREKAIIKEVGPYVYDVKRIRNVTNIDLKSDLFEFMETSYYFFNQAGSKGVTEEDVVTMVDVFLMGMETVWEYAFFKMNASAFDEYVAIIPELNKPFTKVRVKDLLFDGISFPCVNVTEKICSTVQKRNMQLLGVSGNVMKLSMFNHINGTEIGPFEVYGGQHTSKRGLLRTYKGKTKLATWLPEGHCDVLKGTNAYAFPVSALTIDRFFPDLCRSLSFVMDKHSSVRDVATLLYISTKEPFDAVRENACFCKAKRTLATSLTCNIKGTMDLQKCKNFPLVVSYPHFYLGDVALNNYIEGLNPEKSLHGSFISVEENTGTELVSKIRLQFNIKLRQLDLATLTRNLTEGIFPILWFEEVHPLEEKYYNYFLNKINFVKGLRIGKYFLVYFGILVMFLSSLLVGIQEVYLTQKVPIQRDDFSGLVISEKAELGTANVNLYPQLINRNVSDSFMRAVSD